jgi:hypothetical protein
MSNTTSNEILANNRGQELTYIYALCDPEFGEFMYVGQSINPEARYRSHITRALRNTNVGYIDESKRAIWIRQLINKGQMPELFILETVSKYKASLLELSWITKLTECGYNLTNGLIAIIKS